MVEEGRAKELIRDYMGLMHSMGRVRPRMDNIPMGLTDAEMKVLFCIDHLGATRPGEVSKVMQVSSSALSQTLGSLERKGMIVRERSEVDSRSVKLTLTAEGHQAEAELFRLGFVFMERLIDYVGEDEFGRFLDILRKIQEFQLGSGAFEQGSCSNHCRASKEE